MTPIGGMFTAPAPLAVTAPASWAPGSGPWGMSFERAVGLAYAIAVVVDILISVRYLADTMAATSPLGVAAVVVGTLALLGSAAAAVAGNRRPALALATLGVLLAAQCVVPACVTDPGRMPAAWWAWQLMVPAFVLVVALIRPARAVPVLLVAIVVYLLVRTDPASGPTAGPITALSELSLAVVFAVEGFALLPAWRRTGEIADESTCDRRAVFVRTAAARAVERQERAASRLLHDEVIHALRAVALPAAAIDASRVRAAAARAVELLGQAGPGVMTEVELGPAMQRLVEQSCLPITLRLSGSGRLPARVVAALTGATGEALRNCERHAQCTSVVVDVVVDHEGCTIRITDDGRGFDPAAVSSGPLGFGQSILARVAEVGGAAEVGSAPGAGTTWTLTWRIDPPTGSSLILLTALAGTRRRIVVGLAVPGMALVIVQAALHHDRLTDPTPALVAVGVIAVLTFIATWTITRRPLSRLESLGLISAAVVAALVGGVGLLPSSDIPVAYFASGAGAPVLVLVAVFRPAWESVTGVLLAGAVVVVVLLRLVPDGSLLLSGLPAVTATVLGVATLLGCRTAIDRVARSIRRQEEMAQQTHAAAAELQVSREVLASRLGRVQAFAGPFLAAVGDGRTDPDAPGVRRQATVLEAAIRDDIQLGAHLDDRTRELIAATRTAGRSVEVIADGDASPALPPGLVAQLLAAALGGPDGPDRTVLTVLSAPSGPPPGRTVSLMVSPPPSGPALTRIADEWGVRVLLAPDLLLVRFDPWSLAAGPLRRRAPRPTTDWTGEDA